MLKISKWCFLAVAVLESAFILWDCGGPEVMVTDLFSLEDIRFFMIVVSIFFAAALDVINIAPDS